METDSLTAAAVLGTDKRQAYLAKLLEADGFTVTRRPVYEGEVIVGPTPCSKDGVTVPAEDGPAINLLEMFSRMKEGQILIAGAISPKVRALAAIHGLRVIDLMECEDVAVANAVPTAEGAIQLAMERSDITLHGSSALVTGFGRCGKVLARALRGLGAGVTIACRKECGFIDGFGFTSLRIDGITDTIEDFDFIFNTVPALVINAEALARAKKETVIIDIASAPGGVDFKAAEEHGLTALLCPGIPGIAAPKTAAEILEREILKIAGKEGVPWI